MRLVRFGSWPLKMVLGSLMSFSVISGSLPMSRYFNSGAGFVNRINTRSRYRRKEAIDVAERGGKEGFHMFFAFEESMNVEKLLPGRAKETFGLFRLGG